MLASSLTSGCYSETVGPKTTIVLCTNGLPFWFHRNPPSTDRGALARSIDPKQLLGCVGMISGGVFGMYERWESHWPSEKNTLLLGEPWPNRKSAETAPGPSRALRLAALFEGSEVRVGVSETDRIRDRIFDKLLINCSINSIGALTGADIGQTCVRISFNHYCGTWFSRRQLWRLRLTHPSLSSTRQSLSWLTTAAPLVSGAACVRISLAGGRQKRTKSSGRLSIWGQRTAWPRHGSRWQPTCWIQWSASHASTTMRMLLQAVEP